MTRERGRRIVVALLIALAVPGLVLLVRDLLRDSPERIIAQVSEWDPAVARAAERFGVDPALIAAVIAVESKGERDAASDAGAMGLMQLMPATAREVAARIGVALAGEEDLLQPETNILLGTAYLRSQLDAFGDDEVLALAAYNAGPTRVRGWIRSHSGLPSEDVLRLAGFSETRAYVRNVKMYRDLVAVTKGTNE